MRRFLIHIATLLLPVLMHGAVLPSDAATDIEDRLFMLRAQADSLNGLGRTEQALPLMQQLLSTAIAGGDDYLLEQTLAWVDMAQMHADLSDLKEAYRCSQQALDVATTFMTRSMPLWVAHGDIEAIVRGCGVVEDVMFVCWDVTEDVYTASDEPSRTRLRDSLQLDEQIAQIRTLYISLHAAAAASQGMRREALDVVARTYRHLLCHMLLLAQRMLPADGEQTALSRTRINEVLTMAAPDESAYIRATARMAAHYTVTGDYDSTLVWLTRLEQLDADSAYRDVITENRAWIAACRNQWQTALPLLRQRFVAKQQALVEQFCHHSAKVRRNVWLSQYLWYFRQNIALCIGEHSPEPINAFAYDNVLASKGILLSTETTLHASRRGDTLSLARMLTLNCQDIRSALRAEDLAVEFVATDDSLHAEHLYALLLRKRWQAPKCVYLGTGESFLPLQKNRNLLLDPRNTQRVWGAILSVGEVADGERIYFSPDGSFYQTGIEYMLLDSMHTIFDRYDVHRLSSTRELCLTTRPDRVALSDTLVLFGGVCYTPQGDQSAVKYLPATLDEIRAIDSIVPHALTYTCMDATEQAFKSLSSHAPRIIHLATHGFHITSPSPSCAARDMLLSRLATERMPSIEDYAMSRSGLLLAGSGTVWGAKSFRPADDGVLTAREIAATDLRGTDIVVLSACKTGLGDMTVDGIAGLQRGFKKAGCRSMLMSLWQVDDAATMMLMREFYRQLSTGATPTQALQRAQFALRTYSPSDNRNDDYDAAHRLTFLRSRQHTYTVTDNHPYASPYYWAAFVLLD